jgi:hypothetical protein
LKIKLSLLLFISLLASANLAIANDSTSIFKVSIGINHTRYKTKGKYYQSDWGHFDNSDTSLTYHDTASYSPLITFSLEEQLDKHFAFLLSLGYTHSKLSYNHSSYEDHFNPYPPIYSYSRNEAHSFKATPNNLLLNFGVKINFHNFYFSPNLKIGYSFGTAIVSDTITVINNSSQTTNINSNTKQYYSFTGFGAALLLGYEIPIKPFPLYIEARADASSANPGTFIIYTWDVCIGIKLRRTKNLRNRSNLI